MPLKKKIKDIMIPIEKYAVVDPEATLQDAIVNLRGSFCTLEDAGFCDEAGPSTMLVVDQNGKLNGVLDFGSVLRVLVPEVAGRLSEKLAALEVSVVFAQAGAEELDQSREGVAARVIKNAQVKVKEVMLKNLGRLDVNDRLLEALKLMFRKKLTMLPVYDEDRLVGIVRDADLFLEVADIVLQKT